MTDDRDPLLGEPTERPTITAPVGEAPDGRPRAGRWARTWPVLASGAVFLSSGAALVVYILTGAPMALVLALLVLVGSLVVYAVLHADPHGRATWLRRVRVGVPTGLLATALYDASRWVIATLADWHVSPFKAFPFFGQALLGEAGESLHVGAGIAFHLLNGIAFGIAYVVWFGRRPVWVGIAYALGLEAFMLALYPGWLDIKALEEFTQMSVLGHVVYGATLALTARWLLVRGDARAGASPT